LVALKGTVPNNIAYKTSPALHTSLWNPLYPYPLKTSGEIYAGVPH